MRGLVAILAALAGLAVSLAAPTPPERRAEPAPRVAWNPAPAGGPGSPVTDVAFAPDGTALASLHEDDTVWAWDMATGKTTGWVRLGLRPGERPHRVAYLPTGGLTVLLARGGGYEGPLAACVLDVAAGRRSSTVVSRGTIGPMAVSPDGTVLAFAGRLWEVATGRELRPVRLPAGLEWDIRFAPDGRRVAYRVCDGLAQNKSTIAVAEVATGRVLTQIGRLDWAVADLQSPPALSPDGTAVAFQALGPGGLTVWDVAAGRPVWQRAWAGGLLEMVGFTPGGKALVTRTYSLGRGEPGPAVHLWDAATGKQLRAAPHRAGVESAALSPDGTVVALARQTQVEFLRLAD